MANASSAPARRASRELHTDDIEMEQPPVIEDREDLVDDIIVASPDALKKEYQAAIAFNEEPVKIRIERSSEKFAPKVIEVWCNGDGAEVLLNRRWVKVGFLPVGIPVVTKRKYVEILARSKHEAITTNSGKIDEHSERNDIERDLSSKSPFSVIEDRNPRGAEWLTNLVQAR